MNKNQTSQGAHASAFSTRNRKLFLARFFVLALFLALSVMSLQPKTSQAAETRGGKASLASHHLRATAPDCAQACEEAFVMCLSRGDHTCDSQYDTCLARCQ
jgi:hypothetical protein